MMYETVTIVVGRPITSSKAACCVPQNGQWKARANPRDLSARFQFAYYGWVSRYLLYMWDSYQVDLPMAREVEDSRRTTPCQRTNAAPLLTIATTGKDKDKGTCKTFSLTNEKISPTELPIRTATIAATFTGCPKTRPSRAVLPQRVPVFRPTHCNLAWPRRASIQSRSIRRSRRRPCQQEATSRRRALRPASVWNLL